MHRALLIAAGVAFVLGASAPAAFAADSYGTMPGYTVANTHSGCAGHGSFGAFGPGYNLAGGANGPMTGYNNSMLCGNPQGNP